MALDLASFASIRAFAADFLGRYDRLDVLLNNAGLVLQQRSETAEGFESTFGVNHLGHFLLTDLLLDRVRATSPARIINVSSHAHKQARHGLDFDDLQSTRRYRGFAVYSKSKLANIYFTRELARRLAGSGVTVNALHPGFVASRFGRDGDTGRLGDVAMLADAAVRDQRRAGRADVHLPRLLRRPGRDLRRVLVQVRAVDPVAGRTGRRRGAPALERERSVGRRRGRLDPGEPSRVELTSRPTRPPPARSPRRRGTASPGRRGAAGRAGRARSCWPRWSTTPATTTGCRAASRTPG